MKLVQAKNAAEAHAAIERLAKEKAISELRHIETIEIGQAVRQGDIYIHRVDDLHLRGNEASTRQLAVGRTAGSRHVAEAPAEVFEGIALPTWCFQGTFLGPVIASKGRFKVTHPEHAHFSLPAGTYQVTHQMDARTKKRVVD